MIEHLARLIARKIKKEAPDHHASMEVMEFSLSILINAAMILLFTLLISVITDRVFEAIVALIAFPILRQMSGGFHLKTGMGCVLFTTVLMTAISYSNFSESTIVVLGIISLLLAIIYAPSGIENQSRIPKKYYPLLKVISIIIISTNFFILSPIIASAFFVQTLTLIKLRR
ncbi:accessory gene regulator B family protein [Paenibacillus tritici]|uniref:accessory gene regulator ArgB-like protein n=1 Tax=Paenibacillus tritici TaxID=1873425 RepID=UPI001BA4E024|nr:accessory gene regulator B family protein [Paenibacillus tritici]QUL57604.1 accessory gene regulator B family protein [Paenibacillus tritici]